MPTTVTIRANPDFKAKTEAQKATYAAIKAKGELTVDYATAMENMANSGGMYAIKPEEAPATVGIAPVDLDGMATEQLKVMMLTLGITPQKQMKRGEIIRAIRLKLDDIEIVEDETGE